MANSSSTSNPGSNSTTSTGSQNSFSIQGEQLQSYIQSIQATFVEKPGYEIYFYSRADTNCQVLNNTNSTSSSVPTVNTGLIQDFTNVTPTASVNSYTNSSNGNLPLVVNIEVIQTVGEEGSRANIRLIQPTGLTYFSETIGTNKPGLSDFDSSFSGPPHLIGTMDTVLIKLKNGNQTKTVFRGVISTIKRSKSVGGSVIDLECNDFSEFLKNIVGVKNGLWSTTIPCFTGRGIVYYVLNYANNLLNGDKQLFNIKINQQELDKATQLISNIVQLGVTYGTNGSALTNINDAASTQYTNFAQHAMTVPPFFYLQYAEKAQDANAIGNVNIAQQISSFFQTLAQNTETSIQALLSGTLLSSYIVTPEDQETVQTYSVAFNNTSGKTQQRSVANNTETQVLPDFQKYSWILSDLYIEKLFYSFEHKKVWNVLTETAARGFREVYFDFAPQINYMTATNSYIPLDNKLIKTTSATNLHDMHPNIGIVKYRLSPSLIPYISANLNTSEFNLYSISDNQVISYVSQETERGVTTAILGYGATLTPEGITQGLVSLLTSESDGFALAQTINPQYEQRLGYRFNTMHDQKLAIPILRYLVSYVLLEKSQLSMFSQQVQINGNPNYYPGSIVQLSSKNTDYYCTAVAHQWSLQGYTTTLYLEYGHRTGSLPFAIIEGGTATINTNKCVAQYNTLTPFLKGQPQTIGGVNTQCFVNAIWGFWCGYAQTNLQEFSKEYQTQLSNGQKSVQNNSTDWITLSTPNMPTTYDSIISNAISATGLNKYNVTLNTIKNIINDESSFNPQAGAGGSYVGLMQVGQSTYPGQDLTNPTTNIQAGCQILLSKFTEVNAKPGCSGTTWLKAIQAYNGLAPNGSTDPSTWNSPGYNEINGQNIPVYYCTKVFGATQAQAIANNQQIPGPNGSALSAILPTGTNSAWPYFCYGPCGIRVHQANSNINENPNAPQSDYNAVVSQLENFSSGMTLSVTYLVKLLQQYQNSNSTVQVTNAPGRFNGLINNSSTLQKAIAAWYSDNIAQSWEPKFNATNFTNALTQITNNYNTCLNCAGTSITPNLNQGLNAQFANITFSHPTNGVGSITSPFGPRTAPTPGGSTQHKGVDIGNNNQPFNVYAAQPGTVVYAGYDSSAGHFIEILHSNNYMTRYLDLGTLNVQTGQVVAENQLIGVTGPGPNETGIHLHFEIRTGATSSSAIGAAQNPTSFNIQPPLQ